MKKAISRFLVFAFLLWQGNVLHIHKHHNLNQATSGHHSHYSDESFKSEICSDHQDAPQSHQHISEDCRVCDLNTQSPAEWSQPKFFGQIIHFSNKINPFYFQQVESVLPDNSNNKSPPHLG